MNALHAHGRNVANFLLFQAGWFACAFGAGAGAGHLALLAVAGILTVHLYWISRNRRRDLLFILTVGVLGAFLDSTQGYFGVLSFHGDWHAPPWLFGLWMVFASTLHYSLDWLRHRYGWLILLGAAGGGLSYYGGHQFGALELAAPAWQSALIIAAVWSAVTPLLFGLARCFERPGFRPAPDNGRDRAGRGPVQYRDL